MASSRLPGKPLLEAGGKSLLHHVYDRAKRTKLIDAVVVTSPDKDICEYCSANKIPWFPSRLDNPTGTHRVAEIVGHMKCKLDVVVNWQCDEPMVEPSDVADMIRTHKELRSPVTTLVGPFPLIDMHDESIVKAIVFRDGTIQWFSRAPMQGASAHVGVYVFNPRCLQQFGEHPVGFFGQKESLEQLDWLEAGFPMLGHKIDSVPLAVNTEEDFQVWKQFVKGKSNEDDRDRLTLLG